MAVGGVDGVLRADLVHHLDDRGAQHAGDHGGVAVADRERRPDALEQALAVVGGQGDLPERRQAYENLAKRTGLEEGVAIKPPIVELFYKSDPLGDPMITEDHVRMLKLASPKAA